MKKILLFIALCLSNILFAQETTKILTIKGKVIEKKSNLLLEFATISVINSSDNKIITGTITDDKGNFTVKTSSGKYSIKVEFIGLKSVVLENIDLQTNQTIPTIYLEENTTQLETVEIKTEKSTIEHKLDKKIFNVGNDLISKGGNATDILNNVPSVNVTTEGVVSLRGNSGVRILINGKPSVLSANNGLEQIPSENIEKVEVITNPSSKYDSQGTAGIINIVLKKNKMSGFGSSAQITTGTPNNHALGYNVSYKNKKINLFSDLRYQYLTRFREESSLRTNYNNNVVDSYLESTANRVRNNKTFNIYFGGDYYFNDKNTITLSYYYRNNTSNDSADYKFNFLDNNRNFTQIITARETYREPQIANQIELNYIKTFDKVGKKFTINLQYNFWNDDENEAIQEEEKLPTISKKALKSRDIESSKDFLFQTDYTIPITEKSKIEFGLKGEIRRINSDYEAFEDNTPITNLTNLLNYKENIFGIYFQYGSSFKKLEYQLGLRTEHSNTGSNDRINLFNINKKYTNFFPTAHLTYGINDELNLQLSYSRRISRPQFWQLNPFGGIADRRNIRIGNPDLNPMFTDSYELGTLIKWKKLSINPSVYHQFSRNIFEDIRTTDTSGNLVEQAINSGTESRLGAEISITYSPIKWLTLSGEMNYYKFNQKGVFSVSDNAFTSRLNSRIKFSTWNFQTNLNHQGARKSGQINADAQYWVDLGMGKDIWKEKATITFKIDNVFDSRISQGVVTGTDYTLDYNFKNARPRIYATFTYRFNRKKSEKDRLPE
nr:outer membrane beta-barrel family protein [uncultured Flavobacterium sp.]